jgi:hypothetical protein
MLEYEVVILTDENSILGGHLDVPKCGVLDVDSIEVVVLAREVDEEFGDIFDVVGGFCYHLLHIYVYV